MNAEPLIQRIVSAARVAKLDLILIGNAGAALQGVPVTTLDMDFFVRDVEAQLPKIRCLADSLGAVLIMASSPMTRMVKIENESEGLFLDLLDAPAGMPGFASVRKRAVELSFDGQPSRVFVAALRDIIASKRQMARPKDLAVLPLMELTRDEQERLSQDDPREPGT